MKLLFPIILVLSLTIIACQSPSSNTANDSFADNWEMFSSDGLDASGKEISSLKFKIQNSYNIKIPATVMAGLRQTGKYANVFVGKNLEDVDVSQFEMPWWYRKKFDYPEAEKSANVSLILEGVNYRANVWVNGNLVASADTVEQAFRMFTIDITNVVKAKDNIVAIETIPPAKDDLTIGFVDWNPTPPDKNLGLWRGVKLVSSGKVGITNTFVQPLLDTKDFNEASLIISTEVSNNTDQALATLIEGKIGNINFKKNVSLNPNSTTIVKFTQEEFKQLNIKDPKVWWPNGYGDQPLYNLSLVAKVENNISDSEDVRFGIRKVEDYINDEGHRGYIINGQKILIKSAGWVDDIFLADSDKKVRNQLEYVRNMNLNSVRLEGFWGKNKTIYEAADELGLLLMIGWSCHWEWKGYCGREEDEFMMIYEDEFDLHTQAYIDQVKWGRNHPSIFLWVFGSDKLIPTELERMLVNQLKIDDPTRPTLSTCKNTWSPGPATQISEVSGDPAVKMLGPYGYVTPNYWYEDTMAGGAFGFNTETGPGPQVPPIESIKKMIPQENLWPIDDVWDYHQGRNEFQTLDRYLKAFNARYGQSNSAEDFAMMSQISNYEAIRAMYEAFQVNRHNATGIVQWMLNSAWPEMFWQQYDYYMMPNGAFYGTQVACRPINIVYNYKDKNVYVVNELFDELKNYKAVAKVYDINSKLILEKEADINLAANKSELAIKLPKFKNATTTYFVHLELQNSSGKPVADNFYWLSTKDDVIDFDKYQWFITPNKSYADLTALRTMPKVSIYSTLSGDTNKDGFKGTITLKNTSNKIAFGIESLVVDKKSGLSILPVYLSDNYVSLLPGETKTISVNISAKDVEGKQPVLNTLGVNLN